MTLPIHRPKQYPAKSPATRAGTNTVFVDDDAEENWFSIGLNNVRERKELKIERKELKFEVAYLKKELKKAKESYPIHRSQLKKALELIQHGKFLLANRDSKMETIKHELEQTKKIVKMLQKVLKDKDLLGQMVTREKYEEGQLHLMAAIKTVKERNVELAKLTQSLQVGTANCDDLKTSLSSTEKELASAKSTIKEQNDNLTKLNSDLASSEKKLEQLSSELNTAIINLTTVTAQRDDLQKDLDVAQGNVASYKSKPKNQVCDVSVLNEKLSLTNLELKPLGSELSSTTVSSSKVAADCDTLQKSLGSARKQVFSEQTAAFSKNNAIWDTKTAECADLDTVIDKCTHSNGDLEMVVEKPEHVSAMVFEAQQTPSEIERLKQALEMTEIMLALSASTNLQTIYDEGRNLEDHQLPASECSYTSRIIKSQAQELTRYGARIAKQEADIINAGEINGDLEIEVLRLRSLSGDAGPCTRFEQAQKGETKEWCECIKCSTYKQLSKKFLGRIQLLEEESFIMGEQIKELGSPHPQFTHLEKLHAIRREQLEFEAQLNKDEIQYLKKKAATDKAFYHASQTSSEKNSCFKEDIFEGIEPVQAEDQEENMEGNAEEDGSREDDDDYDDSASESSVEFIGTDNLKKPTPKPATIVQDLAKRTETISPSTIEQSASSENESSPTITAAGSISTPNQPNDIPIPNDNMAMNAITFTQKDQSADNTVQQSDKGDKLEDEFTGIMYGDAEESISPCVQLDVADLKATREEPIEVLCQTKEETSPVQDEYVEILNGLGEGLEKDTTCEDIDAAEYYHEQHEVVDLDDEDDYDLEFAEFLAAQDTITPLEVSQATPLPLVVSNALLEVTAYTLGPKSNNLWNDKGTTPSIALSTVQSRSDNLPINMATPCPERQSNRFDRFGASHQLKTITDIAQLNRVNDPSLAGVQISPPTPKENKIQSTPMLEPKKALAPTARVFTPTTPVFAPTVPVFIPTAAVFTPETTMTAALVQEHAGQEDMFFGTKGNVLYLATKTNGLIGKSGKNVGSLCPFCKISNHVHSKDTRRKNRKNICCFCDKSNYTHTEDNCHRNPKNKKPKARGKLHHSCRHCGDLDHQQAQCPKYEYFMQMNNEIQAVALCSITPKVKPSHESLRVAQSTGVANGNGRASGGRQTPLLCKLCNHGGHTEKNCPKKKEENRMLQKMYEIQPKSAAPSKNLSQLNLAAPTGRQPPHKKTGGLLSSKYAPGNNRDNGNGRNSGNS